MFLFSDSQQIPIEGSLPQGFLDFGIERFLGIHWLVWVRAALAVALTWMLEKTPYGRAGSAWPWAGDHRRRGRRPAQAPGLEWRFEEDLGMKKLLSALGLVLALPLATVRSAAFVALATALLGGCASSPPAGVPASVTVVPDSRGVQRVNVIAGNYYFQPSHVIVRAGLPVELTIERHSLIPHTFTIAAPTAGIAVDVKLSREPTTVSFTPKAPGSYRFICTEDPPFLASHLERGMQGTLEVLP